MNNKFFKPELEVVRFSNVDMIATSGAVCLTVTVKNCQGYDNSCGSVCGVYCSTVCYSDCDIV